MVAKPVKIATNKVLRAVKDKGIVKIFLKIIWMKNL